MKPSTKFGLGLGLGVAAPYAALFSPAIGASIGKKVAGGNKRKEKKYSGIGGLTGLAAGIAAYPLMRRMSSKLLRDAVASGFRTGGYRYSGYGYGGAGSRSYSSPSNPFSSHFDAAKTKAEAKGMYRDLMMKHHPDKGGKVETAQHVSSAWENFKKSGQFDKLAFIRKAFFEELEKNAFRINKKIIMGAAALSPVTAYVIANNKALLPKNTFRGEYARTVATDIAADAAITGTGALIGKAFKKPGVGAIGGMVASYFVPPIFNVKRMLGNIREANANNPR